MNGVTYKRELSHSYMVVKSESCDIAEHYACRMMMQNRIGRLLPCSRRQLDGEQFLYYDISSKQPLERLYEARRLDAEGMKQIIYAIAAMQADLGEYLLDEQGLMLEAGTIFADVETEELFFCYDPEQQSTSQRYMKLADFFLGHVDHGEACAVHIAYQFYKMSQTEYFVLSSFLPFLEKELEARHAVNDGVQTGGWEDLSAEESRTAYGEGEKSGAAWMSAGEAERALWEDLQESDGAAAVPKEKKSWFRSFFFRKRKTAGTKKSKKSGRKRRFAGREPEEEKSVPKDWQTAVWNSYAGQEAFVSTGETIYFADLDKPKKAPKGIPCLEDEDQERQFRLENLPLTVGKLKGRVAIVLEDRSVSRMHARFENGEGGICVRDLNSRNGTLVNGKKLAPNEAAELSEGDLIQFGRERFRYGFIDSKALK